MVQTAYIYILFFSPMCSQVWRKSGICKDCKDHAVEQMNVQWESVD